MNPVGAVASAGYFVTLSHIPIGYDLVRRFNLWQVLPMRVARDSYYLIGLAMIPDLNDKVKKYTASVAKLNDNRTADQITRDDLTAAKDGAFQSATQKKDEIVLTFAKAVVAGGGYAAQARTKLQEYATAPGELDKALEDAKANLG